MFVKVPEDSFGHWVNPIITDSFHYHTPQSEGMSDIDIHTDKLPEGNWQFIALSTEITEEQCYDVGFEGIVEILEWPANSDKPNVKEYSPLGELKLAMHSLDLHELNPLSEPQYWNQFDMVNFDYDKELEAYKQAQQRTGPFAILFKPKTV